MLDQSKNKEEFILEYIKDLKLDITVVTETWLQDTDEDAFRLN